MYATMPLTHFTPCSAYPASRTIFELSHTPKLTCESYSVGVVDDTIHPKWRPAYRQGAYYRKDKSCHFISTQITVDSSGVIIDMEIGYEGCHRDQSNWYNSSIYKDRHTFLGSSDKLLADKEYSGARLIVPHRTGEVQADPSLQLWNDSHAEERWIVEYSIAYLKRYAAVLEKCRHPMHLQIQTIHAGGLLANRQLKVNPLR